MTTMLINEVWDECKKQIHCYECPKSDECEELMEENVEQLPLGFYLAVMEKERKIKRIKARLLFDAPIANPLSVGALVRMPEKGVYLIWTPERELERVNSHIKDLQDKLKALEERREALME